MECINCGNKMEKVKYDLGFGISVDSYTCSNCHHNITDEKTLDDVMKRLREKMALRVKIIRVGTGVGIRIPNEIARKMKLKQGKEVEIIPQTKQIVIREK